MPVQKLLKGKLTSFVVHTTMFKIVDEKSLKKHSFLCNLPNIRPEVAPVVCVRYTFSLMIITTVYRFWWLDDELMKFNYKFQVNRRVLTEKVKYSPFRRSFETQASFNGQTKHINGTHSLRLLG